MAFEPNPNWKAGEKYPAARMVEMETVVAANESAVAGKADKSDIPAAPTADTLSGATSTGRNVLKAADAAAARDAIGAGTSSLALGTTSTTAAKGDHTHAYADLTGKPTIPSVSGLAKQADLEALVARVAALETPVGE